MNLHYLLIVSGQTEFLKDRCTKKWHKLDGTELNPETNELSNAGGVPDMLKVLLPQMTNTQFEIFKNDK